MFTIWSPTRCVQWCIQNFFDKIEKVDLRTKIQEDIKEALKKKEEQRLATLRFLKSEIDNREIAQGRKELTDEEVTSLINGQIKKLKESLSFFERGKREDLIRKTKAEIEILKNYLPEQLSDQELEKEIERVINQNPSVSHPGTMIGLCIKALAGRVDNQRIAQVVNKKFKS